MKERLFRFKQFSVAHSRSALKVGVDGVLVAAWGGAGAHRVLDAGCGCGVIALICAQLSPDASVTGFDIHLPSVAEARDNVLNSPWPDRVEIVYADIDEYVKNAPAESFDLVISNPPFFDAGVKDISTDRLKARHTDGFGPMSLPSQAAKLLCSGGRLVMIAPAAYERRIIETAIGCGLQPSRICTVSGRPELQSKRVLLEFKKGIWRDCLRSHLCIERSPGSYSEEYVNLTKDFYLRF